MKYMKNISKKLLLLPILMVLITMSVMPAGALDADTPYTVTMNLIIPSDSTFTVALAGSETTIDFNPTTKDSTEVEPDSQVASGDTTPIAVITNAGNVNLNFSVNLTAAKPSWVVLKAHSDGTYASATTYDTTAIELTAWKDITPTSTADVYLWADFTSALGGTTQRTFQVNTVISV